MYMDFYYTNIYQIPKSCICKICKHDQPLTINQEQNRT